jgi:hypothetical protein
VAPVGNGETLPAQEQMAARRVFVRSADRRFETSACSADGEY